MTIREVRFIALLGGIVVMPTQIWLSTMGYTIPKVEVDQTLIRNPGFFRQRFEIGHDVFSHPDRDLFLEL
jgi:hypothetical protein